MIKFVQGDLFEAKVEALVNPVNCEGVMGRGIAECFKEKFPENFKAYAAACERGEVKPGQLHIFDAGLVNTVDNPSSGPKYIINFPTKDHWRGKSHIAYIEAGLIDLVNKIRERHIRSIAIPALGCGLGGLNWIEVRLCIEKALKDVEEVDIYVYGPRCASADYPKQSSKNPSGTKKQQ